MDISGITDFIKRLITEIILPNLGKIALIAVAAIVILTLLRIFVPMIWENILVGIIKISDKKTNNKKEDE
ncbi:hypothetical protein [Huintestinicola sp.]